MGSAPRFINLSFPLKCKQGAPRIYFGGLKSSAADLKAPAFYVPLSISSRCLLSQLSSIPLFWRKHMYLPIVNRVEVDDVVCFTVLRCSLSLHDIVTAFNVNKDLIRIKLWRNPPWLKVPTLKDFSSGMHLPWTLFGVCSFPKGSETTNLICNKIRLVDPDGRNRWVHV